MKKMMKTIILVNPKKKCYQAISEPLTLITLANYLRKENIEVKITDLVAGDNFKKDLKMFNPDYIGITATTPSINNAFEIADYASKRGYKVIIGGKHTPAFPQEALKHCDCVVIGEGEIALANIIKNGIKKKIVYGKYLNLDTNNLPSSSRDMVNMDFYTSKCNVRPLMTSRGCPYKCIYCYNSWRQEPLRYYPVDYVIDEIEMLIDEYNADDLFFFDDSFLTNKARLKEICNKIIERNINIKWKCQTRTDSIDEETLKIIKKAGCNKVFFGIESGSQRILDLLKKETTVEQNIKAINLCNQIGMEVKGLFMIGNPTETEEDIKMTQEFILNNSMTDVSVLYLTPYPSTKLWEMFEDEINKVNINWNDLRMGVYPVNLTSIPKKRLTELFCETVNISYKSTNIPTKQLIIDSLSNPLTTLKLVMNNPSKIMGLLK